MDNTRALIDSALIRLYLEYGAQFWPPQLEMDTDTLKCTQETDHDGKGTGGGRARNTTEGKNTDKKHEKRF